MPETSPEAQAGAVGLAYIVQCSWANRDVSGDDILLPYLDAALEFISEADPDGPKLAAYYQAVIGVFLDAREKYEEIENSHLASDFKSSELYKKSAIEVDEELERAAAMARHPAGKGKLTDDDIEQLLGFSPEDLD